VTAPRYRLARQVIADLEGIADYLGRRSPSASDRVMDELLRAFESLAHNPEAGTNVDHVRPQLRLLVPSNPSANYLVFYYVVTDGVMISSIIHAARDWIGMFDRGER
jgi:plasmid stabilization system protein ParE